MTSGKSDAEIELAKLQLERDKFEYEKARSGRLTASQLALLGSLISVASGLLGAAITGWFSKHGTSPPPRPTAPDCRLCYGRPAPRTDRH